MKFDYFCLFTHLSNVLFKLKKTAWKNLGEHTEDIVINPKCSQNRNPECPLQTEHWISEQNTWLSSVYSSLLLPFIFCLFVCLFLRSATRLLGLKLCITKPSFYCPSFLFPVVHFWIIPEKAAERRKEELYAQHGREVLAGAHIILWMIDSL